MHTRRHNELNRARQLVEPQRISFDTHLELLDVSLDVLGCFPKLTHNPNVSHNRLKNTSMSLERPMVSSKSILLGVTTTMPKVWLVIKLKMLVPRISSLCAMR